MEIFTQSRSSLRLNNDDDDPFLGSHIGVREMDALTTKTNMEIASSSKATHKKHKYCISIIKLFGGRFVLGLVRLVVNFYLKNYLHLDLIEDVTSGFSALSWHVKPLCEFISDSVLLFGYQRKSYLIQWLLRRHVGSLVFDGIVSSYFSRFLLDAYGVRFTFGVITLFSLLAHARVFGKFKIEHYSIMGFYDESSLLPQLRLWLML
ncbi:Folate-biopterin transporter 1, chloroplastic, partial [Mucuna pruriens]